MTSTRAPNKKQLCARESYDFISNLPDDVITLILSRLPMLEAVRTSVLSRDWANKWWTSSLKEFRYHKSCTINLSSATCFANLESLWLSSRNKQSPNTRRILLTFHVMKTLWLKNCIWLDVDYVEIQAPELISFKVISYKGDANDYEIKICGPKITKFSSGYWKIENFVVTAPAVTHATLHHSDIENLAFRAGMLLKEFRNLKFLNLSGEVNTLAQSKSKSEPKSLLVFSTLYQLKELELEAGRASKTNIGNVLKLLETLPSLEKIMINCAVIPISENLCNVNVLLFLTLSMLRLVGSLEEEMELIWCGSL